MLFCSNLEAHLANCTLPGPYPGSLVLVALLKAAVAALVGKGRIGGSGIGDGCGRGRGRGSGNGFRIVILSFSSATVKYFSSSISIHRVHFSSILDRPCHSSIMALMPQAAPVRIIIGITSNSIPSISIFAITKCGCSSCGTCRLRIWVMIKFEMLMVGTCVAFIELVIFAAG